MIGKAKKKIHHKLLIQIGILLTLIFSLSVFVNIYAIYGGSVKMYLQAKNDMISADLERIKKPFDYDDKKVISWLFKEWERIGDKISDPVDEDEKADEEINKKLFASSDESIFSSFKKVRYPRLERLTDKEKERVAKMIYYSTMLDFAYSNKEYNYDSLYCIDIGKASQGFTFFSFKFDDLDGDDYIFYDESKLEEYKEEYKLGKMSDYTTSDHPAIETILAQNEPEIVYETVEGSGEKDKHYIGYITVAKTDDMCVTVCISYNWSEFASSLSGNLRIMAVLSLGGSFVSSALILFSIYTFAIKPLRKVKHGVQTYMKNKDKDEVVRSMSEIRTQNEFGILANDISQLAVEIDRYTNENVQLATEKERVSAELDLAARIQSGSLPKEFPEMENYDLYAYMKPAKEVGGDFYDFFFIDEDHLGMVIADVSGKGIPAALFMMMTKILLKNYIMANLSPAQALYCANNKICENNPNNMFVTAWLGIIDLKTGHVVASNAGHEYPILRTGDGKYDIMKDKHGFVLGGIEDKKYDEYEFDLEKNGAIFLYTDGVAEATNTKNELFGTSRIVDALNNAPDASPKEILDMVNKEVDKFVGDAAQFDDLTMLCIKNK